LTTFDIDMCRAPDGLNERDKDGVREENDREAEERAAQLSARGWRSIVKGRVAVLKDRGRRRLG
jgi:hypothetical protein